jgi:putative transposase
MMVAQELSARVGIETACETLGINRATFYRHRKPAALSLAVMNCRPRPPLSLMDSERQTVLGVLRSERFADQSPKTTYNILLDEGIHLCSVRTMYRILAEEDEVRERRRQLRHPQYKKPELVATAPNQVWSWDITKLKGPIKGTFFHLYVILDIFSRYVTGWMVAEVESGELAKRFIADACSKQGIASGKLTVHSDRGTSMKSKLVTDLLCDLGVTKSHGRPKVSDDNPFSEAQFKTLKYHPVFPDRFGSIEDAQGFCRAFFRWYNNEHLHSGIAMLTPAAVHYGEADKILEKREHILAIAAERHPSRFKGKLPALDKLPTAVWINPPILPDQTKKVAES